MKKWLAAAAAVLLCLLPVTALANSGEPPSLTVMVLGAPEGLELWLEVEDEGGQWREELYRWDWHWERYYHGYGHDGKGQPKSARLVAKGPGVDMAVPVPLEMLRGFRPLITLRLPGGQLSAGQPFWRTPLLVLLRMGLTFLIEGGIFYCCRYRERRSWLVFLITNLATQGWLNFQLVNCDLYFYAGKYLLMMLGEPLIFIVEMLAFAFLIKEQRRAANVGTAFLCNLFSLGLGLVVINALPL